MTIPSPKLPEMPSPHFFTTTSSSIKPPFRQPLFFLKPFTSSSSSSSSSSSNKATKNPFQTPSATPQSQSSPWINQWSRSIPPTTRPGTVVSAFKEKSVENYVKQSKEEAGASAIDRIVLRLRNLGLGSDDEDEGEEEGEEEGKKGYDGGGEKLGDLLKRDWVRPDMILAEEEEGGEEGVLPWEREEFEERRRRGRGEEEVEEGREGRRLRVRAPSLAELTIEDEELRRLRRDGMGLRERVSVPKGGITNAVLESIHEKWRRNEVVRLKFHELLARDMKTAHQIVEVVILQFVFLVLVLLLNIGV